MIVAVSDEHFRRLHGEVLRRPATLAQPPVPPEGGGLRYVHEGPGRVSSSLAGEGGGGGTTKVSRAGKRAQRDGHPIEEGFLTRGRGGGSQALRRVVTQCHEAEVEGLRVAHKIKVERLSGTKA